MKAKDYLKDCLKDKEFKIIWEEETQGKFNSFEESIETKELNSIAIREALNILEEIDESELNSIIDNKGVQPKTNNLSSVEIIFYENKEECPVKEFLNEISDKKLKVKTLKNILELSIKGSDARPPLSKYIDEGIFELRTKQGSNIDRIFYFFIFGNKIIMTNCYIKKTQKLDEQEFKKAKKYRDDYMKNFK